MFEATFATPAYLAAPAHCETCERPTPPQDMHSASRCRSCEAARRAAWYQSNKAACAARKRAWRARNPEKVRAMRERYRAKAAVVAGDAN